MTSQQHLGKRERNKHERKERLYLAAMDLFRRQGFEETRVEEITQAAGVAKGTFFNYFPTKEEVLLFITERHLSRLGTALVTEATTWNGTGPRDGGIGRLKSLLHALADSLQEDRELVCLSVHKAMKLSQLAAMGADSRLGFASLTALLISRAQRSGEIHPDLDPLMVAQILEGLYYQQLVVWCQQDFSFDLGERLDQLVDLLIMGIGYRKVKV